MKNQIQQAKRLKRRLKMICSCLLCLFAVSCIVINRYKNNQIAAVKSTDKIFFRDVAPIINNKCMNCHSSERTLVNFSDYESIYGRRAMIEYVIENDLMPPWPVARNTGPWKNNLSLTVKEKQMFLNWLRAGLPYKSRDIDLKVMKRSSFIADPDYVMKLKETIKIPATGVLPYKQLIFEPNFKTDKWIKEIEFVLKPKVIHHLTVRFAYKKQLSKLKKSKKESPDAVHFLGKRVWGWTFGAFNYKDFGEDTGIKIPGDTFFIIYIHYEPIGREVTDFETNVKIVFHSKIPKYSLVTFNADNTQIKVPPYQNNYLDEVKYKIKKQINLVSTFSHMHLRGKASSIVVVSPEGQSKEIFKLSTYNFNFQPTYEFKKPLLIRKNSIFICRNWFDNSSENPVNPDPSKTVKWGLNTNDEMSLCNLSVIIPTAQENEYDQITEQILHRL